MSTPIVSEALAAAVAAAREKPLPDRVRSTGRCDRF